MKKRTDMKKHKMMILFIVELFIQSSIVQLFV